jgi:ubiquinone/menaquinone biosynthesis C-methylase UbiE
MGHRADSNSPQAKIASTDAWRARANDDPWFAVASHAGKENHGWGREDFYALGASDWADFLAQWQGYADPRGTCLEIGVGAGRITKHLSTHFDDVIGTDVSDTMLALARTAVPGAELLAVEGTELPLDDDSVDAVFTAHVLQHFETSRDVTALLRESRRVLRPGGTIMAHMLLLSAAEESNVTRWLKQTKRDATRRITRNSAPRTVARHYRPDQVRTMFESAGFVSVELREFRVSSNNDPHPFWFGRLGQSH